jgi:alpha-ketoglutarate-dependent taurine dioxygenase
MKQLSPTIGIEIDGMTGPDLVDRAVAGECETALREHGVVVYREVHIEDADLVAFSRMLGTVVVAPTGDHDIPEIQTITMDPAKTSRLMTYYREGNFYWHIDGLSDEVPQKATLLTAREVDPAGGDTEFASTIAAYDGLPEDEKAAIADVEVVHSFATAQERAHPNPSDKERAMWAKIPERVHPLVWRRRDGATSLVLGATAREVVGMAPEEGRALLDRLLDWATQPRFVLRHRWRRGDLVVWNNTGVLHRAMPFEPTSPRRLHRTTLVGEPAV